MASTASPPPEPPAHTHRRDQAGLLPQPAEPDANPGEPRLAAGPGVDAHLGAPSFGRTPSTSAQRRAARLRTHTGATTKARSAIPTTVWTAPGHGINGADDGAWSPVGRIMAAFPDRAPNAIVLTAEQIAADLDAPAPSAAQRPPIPDADALGAAAATGAATATRGPQLGVAPPAARGATSQVGAEPFWAAMIAGADSASTTARGTTSSTGQSRQSPSVLDRTRTGVPTGPAREPVRAIRRLGASPPGGEWVRRWDLVVVVLGCRPCGDELGLLAANLLAPGGVLAVLTHSERRGGRLIDPTGSVVASAQAADLLYLQHIVILTAPLPATRSGAAPSTGRRPADAQHEPAADAAGEEPAPGNGLMDLLLFLQPGGPNPSSPPDNPLSNVAQAEPPGAEPPTDASPAARHLMNGNRA